jgi:hypothetical protein
VASTGLGASVVVAPASPCKAEEALGASVGSPPSAVAGASVVVAGSPPVGASDEDESPEGAEGGVDPATDSLGGASLADGSDAGASMVDGSTPSCSGSISNGLLL